jgi:hypothetical protein
MMRVIYRSPSPDEQGLWVFIQGSETYEGHTDKTDGGWMLRSFLSNCRDARKNYQ